MPYSIVINTPGYLPESDPYCALELDDAKRALIGEMERHADSADEVDSHALADAISAAQQDVNLWSGPDVVYVTDDDREHDLGTAYSIVEISDDEYIDAYCERDAGSIPCSRYGQWSSDLAPWVKALVRIFQDANGDMMTDDMLDHFMSLLVNDHDDPETLILEHGTDDERAMLTNQYPSSMIPDLFGGQVLMALTDDGEFLCEPCVRDRSNPVHRGGDADGWRVDGWEGSSNVETPTNCAHCDRVLVGEMDD